MSTHSSELSTSPSQPSLSGAPYLQRFTLYNQWNENLPPQPNEQFLAFIHDEAPLSNKLREKWLYQLAQHKDWANFSVYYQPSTDLNLQCFDNFALFAQGKTSQSLNAAKKIWLSPESQPPGCTQLFKLLQNSALFTDDLISQRIILALDNRNVALAGYLLGQYKTPRRTDQKLLFSIHQNPYRIADLKPGPLHDYFYLYGLKQLVTLNMDKAIDYWKRPKTEQLLNHYQKQAFLAHLALYKAMRNKEDTMHWFSQVEPRYYNDTLLDWQIRFALKRQQWLLVDTLIHHYQDKENPCWQYWLARSLEARGKYEEANAIYAPLAKTRHYYGFLASLRLKQTPHFQNEQTATDLARLKPYHSFLNTIRTLYLTKQTLTASRLLNDFTSELPKEDKIALLYWLTHKLQWHAKSVYLSNNDELSNQLTLRFPLAYNQNIRKHAKTYEIPEAFIYAIIRQESGFREDVISSAGARGLMQLLPSTARVVAKTARIPYYNQDQLFLWPNNINIGIAYLSTLAKRFSHHPILMAAAYNAGPRQVVNWLKSYPPTQMDIWIETLPYQETRNYLKNVIAFYTVYEYRMKKQSDLKNLMQPL
ncbi:MAG: lytic murein transglycosylase [Legionellales bacterium RIFCSPHIGHO2_12_FULL_42_9]|nr:MAG: lytic murein transglycosylase [Legionellales bacterium RIFCSPHIGHO2_12_FULL_42_9]